MIKKNRRTFIAVHVLIIPIGLFKLSCYTFSSLYIYRRRHTSAAAVYEPPELNGYSQYRIGCTVYGAGHH